MSKFRKGSTFIKEKTGSATKINLDGQWEQDSVDDTAFPGHKTTPGKRYLRKLKK